MSSSNNEESTKNEGGSKDWLSPLPDLFHKYSPSNTHIKTYTAGEDQGRLAVMAKEFGLAQHRQPRKQVRSHKRRSSYGSAVVNYLHDYTVEDARMRAAWTTSHGELQEDEQAKEQQLYQRLVASWQEGLGDNEQGDEEDGEIMDHHGALGSNLTSAVLGIIKGLVGPAILYLPHAFASSGYATALPILALSTVLYLYSSKCLMESYTLESSKQIMENPQQQEPLLLQRDEEPLHPNKSNNTTTYGSGTMPRTGSKGKVIMLSYPELAYRALGPTGESLVKTGIALMQSGVCLTYLIFVPQNLHSSFLMLFGLNWSPSWWLVVMVLIQIPLSWIRDIRKLTPTNLLANVLIFYGLLLCLGFAVQQSAQGQDDWYRAIYDSITCLSPFRDQWYLFIGTSVLMFEGSITLLVPLQDAVQGEEARAKFPVVYKRVILSIISFEAFFAITCWMGFGDNVRTVLTVSLPPGYLATSVQLAYCVAVIFTYPLQNFPALEIACRSMTAAVKQRHPWLSPRPGVNNSNKNWFVTQWLTLITHRNFQSSVLVCLLAVVAVCTMNSLDKVVSLMGSLLGCPIALFFPPLIHSRLDPSITAWRKLTNYIVSGMGVLAMVAASITTLATWNEK